MFNLYAKASFPVEDEQDKENIDEGCIDILVACVNNCTNEEINRYVKALNNQYNNINSNERLEKMHLLLEKIVDGKGINELHDLFYSVSSIYFYYMTAPNQISLNELKNKLED